MNARYADTPAAAAEARDFEGLLLRMRRGDQQALGALYDRTLARIYALVTRIVRNDADAEEVVCDVYRQAWENSVDYSPARGAVLAWLLTIARSRALDLLRRRRAHGPEQPLHPLDSDAAYSACEGSTAEPGDHDAPQLAWVDALMTGSAVRAALSRLSGTQRRVLELAFFEDLTHSEIAQRTGWPLGTVKSHLRRGLVALRPLLDDFHGDRRNIADA